MILEEFFIYFGIVKLSFMEERIGLGKCNLFSSQLIGICLSLKILCFLCLYLILSLELKMEKKVQNLFFLYIEIDVVKKEDNCVVINFY